MFICQRSEWGHRVKLTICKPNVWSLRCATELSRWVFGRFGSLETCGLPKTDRSFFLFLSKPAVGELSVQREGWSQCPLRHRWHCHTHDLAGHFDPLTLFIPILEWSQLLTYGRDRCSRGHVSEKHLCWLLSAPLMMPGWHRRCSWLMSGFQWDRFHKRWKLAALFGFYFNNGQWIVILNVHGNTCEILMQAELAIKPLLLQFVNHISTTCKSNIWCTLIYSVLRAKT